MDRPSSAPSTPADVDADPTGDAGPQVVGVDSEEADAIMSALSSDTAREVLAHLHEAPDTHSGLADRLDTTIQTVEYHLSNLRDAGLVEADGTVTSEHGQEMTVYAPAEGPLVVLAGDDDQEAGLRATLRRMLGGVGVLALASLVVDRLLRAPGTPGPGAVTTPTATPGATGTPAPTEAPTSSPTAEPTPTEAPDATPTPVEEGTATETAAGGGTPTPAPTDTPVATDAPAATGTPTPTEVAATGTPAPPAEPGLFEAPLAALSPGVVFFLGGLLGILLVVALTRRRWVS